MLCETCKQPMPCAHSENGEYQINTVTGEVRKDPRIKIEVARKLRRVQKKKHAKKRKKNRNVHSDQKRKPISLEWVRQDQLDHPTRAGNSFAVLCSKHFPRRKVLREEIRGFYVLDFYFPSINLGVEIDGLIHARPGQKAHDDNRTAYLERTHGVRILRFTNEQVLKDPESVVKDLTELLADETRKPNDPGNPDSTRACAPADLGKSTIPIPVPLSPSDQASF